MADDIYIQILKYVKSHGIVTLGDLEKEFPEHSQLIGREVENNKLFTPIDRSYHMDGRFSLSFEDYFRLMENQELIEARASSKTALIVAIISIGLNIAALIWSIFIPNHVLIDNFHQFAVNSEVNCIPEAKHQETKK